MTNFDHLTKVEIVALATSAIASCRSRNKATRKSVQRMEAENYALNVLAESVETNTVDVVLARIDTRRLSELNQARQRAQTWASTKAQAPWLIAGAAVTLLGLSTLVNSRKADTYMVNGGDRRFHDIDSALVAAKRKAQSTFSDVSVCAYHGDTLLSCDLMVTSTGETVDIEPEPRDDSAESDVR